ncbi:MFS transporter [Streptomyces sp. NPDC048489]|uniref:MFS transporter n=1 Tax=Streptomyces sp. NPDC048489 TaxID=3154504 RepID=UPI003430E24A
MWIPPWSRVAFTLFTVGWGANQFSPLILVYRQHGIAETTVTAAFAAYALGLMPTLLLAVPLAGPLSRPRLLRAALVLSGASSATLLTVGDRGALLIAGRLLSGIASGAAFSPGTEWIADLSPSARPGTAARRAAVSLTAGFGGGPLIAGLIGQFSSAPEVVPYAAHLCLVSAALVCGRRVPEPNPRSGGRPRSRSGTWRAVFRQPFFVREVIWTAPLVFAAATTSFAVLPSLVPPARLAVAAGGAMAGLTLGAGLAAQMISARFAVCNSSGTRLIGLTGAAVGFAVGAVAVARHVYGLVPVAGVLFGAAYGLLLVSGLTDIEARAERPALAPTVAVFYCLTYLGFVAPYAVILLAKVMAPSVCFLGAAGLTVLLTLVTVFAHRRIPVAARCGIVEPVGRGPE